ncbi:Pentatricopeptide repeat-containing protein At2g31400 [Durusdinium trenchii]|uniref:Chloroplastic n=1 Tax=Durusdinium trenchii TaxID=1381693 RepID=A0ABP0MQW1_9DINO
MAGTTCRLARLKRLTAVIAGLGKSSRWRDALRVGRRSGDTVLHNATMQAATEGRQWEEALAIFQRQRRADRADRVSAGCVVHALARGQHLKRAIHFAKEDGPPGPPWAALIAVCSSASEWQEALAGWAHVDVEDESSLARVMSACTKGLRWDVALCLWQEGGELVPAPAASAALAAASGRLWRLVLQIYGKMQLQSKMSTVQHNLLLGALSKEALWQEAQELLNELSEASQSVRPDVVTYNSVIAACERAWKWTTALHLFTVMRKERLKVSSISCNSLLSAFEKGTQWTKALALLQQMGRWRLQTQVSLCAVASACEKSWQWRRALLHLVGAPDAVSYSVWRGCEGLWGQGQALFFRVQNLSSRVSWLHGWMCHTAALALKSLVFRFLDHPAAAAAAARFFP